MPARKPDTPTTKPMLGRMAAEQRRAQRLLAEGLVGQDARQVVSRLVVGSFAPGAVVPVRVDPGNVAEVMIA